MKLPKIQEDEYPLKNTYFSSITEKPLRKYRTDKLIYDWQAAEIELIARIPDEEQLLQRLVQLQNVCKEGDVPHFYTYFFVDRVLGQLENGGLAGQKQQESEGKSVIIKKIKTQIQELRSKKSRWNRIVQLIQLRENLVSKINKQVANDRLEDVYTHLDDIRFINFEIIKKIDEWSQANKSNSEIHPFFLYQGNNYLVKMINDNTNVINVLNGKAVKFLSPPNPFYLSRDGNKASMSHTQQLEIDNSMETLAREKAQELRMIINPPKFVSEAKNETNELKKLKNQLQSEKVQRIKNAYKTSFSSSSINMRSSIYSAQKFKQKQQSPQKQPVSIIKSVRKTTEKLKNYENQHIGAEKRNRLQKMIQDKQVAVVADLKNSKIRLNKINSSSKEKKTNENKGINKYLSKVQTLRKSVQQNKLASNLKLQSLTAAENDKKQTQTKAQNLMRLSTISNKNQLPKSVADVKAPKPKIRLVMEKQSFVEDVVKTFLPPQNLEMYKSLNVRKSASSFFKPSEKQKEQYKKQREQINVQIKPVTQYARTLSASQITQKQFLKGHSKTKNMFSSSINKSKSKNKDKSKSRSISQKSDLSLSKSPNKRFSVQPQIQQNDEVTSTLNNSDAKLRIVNSKLKQLTIMSIYGKKNKITSSTHNPYITSSKTEKLQTSKLKHEEREEKKNQIDEQLRAVKNRLKELSIKKIYDRKLSTKGFDTKKDKLQQASETNVKVHEAKRDKKEAIQVQNSTKGFQAKKNKRQQADLSQKQKQMNIQNKKTQQQILQKQKQKELMLESLKNKDKRIQQLLQLLKKQQKQKSGPQVLAQQQEKLKEQRQKKIRQIEELKLKIKSQNKLIKQQMQQEQKKYIELKQKEYQMKEQQMLQKYKSDMQQMKEQYIKKNKELEAKIFEQEKIRKEQEIKMLKQQREMEELKMQMEEKRLKEQLLEEILREHHEKELQEEKQAKESEELQKERLKREILEKEEIQRKMLENFEDDNRKLQEMFEAMKRKNEEAQKQNQRKLAQIKRVEQQSKRQQQNLRKLEAELIEARNRLELQQAQSNLEQESQPPEPQDIQQLKLRVKQEILRQMMLKRKEEESQLKAQKEERSKKLAEIEEEIRNELRRQEEQMEKIEKEEREKYQKIKKEMEEQHRRKMEELEKGIKEEANQNNKAEQQAEQQQQQQKNQEQNKNKNEISKQEYERELQKAIELSKIQAEQEKKNQQQMKKKQDQQFKIEKERLENEKRLKIEEQKAQQNAIKKKQQQKNSLLKQNYSKIEEISKQQKKQNKQEPKQQKKPIQQIKPQQKQKPQQQQKPKKQQKPQQPPEKPLQQSLQKQKPSQPKKQATQTQTVKQPPQQILTKYQNLQPHLSKTKQLYMDDIAFPEFVNTFFSSFAPEVKDMMPYTPGEIVKLVTGMSRKMDIYQGAYGHSIGWLEAERYVLLGNIGCVENIVRKYGQVQVQMTYIFNKTNPYQKQFLAKQVKIFDQVGFIFQKKLKQENMYSIKLIIKVPSQILPKTFKPPANQLTIKSKIGIELVSQSPQRQQNPQYCYSYMLSQTLKNCLTPQQQQQFKQDKSEQSRLITNRMHHKIYNDPSFKSQQIDDKKMRIQCNLPLKYIQTHDYYCYLMKGSQCHNANANTNSNTNTSANGNTNKIYTIVVNQNLSVVVFGYDKGCEAFSLDMLLSLKTNKLEKERDLLVCLPVWRKNQDLRLNYPGPKQFTFSYVAEANLSFGSIINTNILKDQYKLIEAPFVFSLFETNDKGLLLRPLSGQIVQPKDIMTHKR